MQNLYFYRGHCPFCFSSSSKSFCTILYLFLKKTLLAFSILIHKGLYQHREVLAHLTHLKSPTTNSAILIIDLPGPLFHGDKVEQPLHPPTAVHLKTRTAILTVNVTDTHSNFDAPVGQKVHLFFSIRGWQLLGSDVLTIEFDRLPWWKLEASTGMEGRLARQGRAGGGWRNWRGLGLGWGRARWWWLREGGGLKNTAGSCREELGRVVRLRRRWQ